MASNGSFSTRWKVRRSGVFVGLWRGDDRHAGDETTAVSVKVTRRTGKRRR